MNGFEGQRGLLWGDSEACGKQRLHSSRGTYRISRLQGPGKKQSLEGQLDQTHLLIPQRLRKRPEAKGLTRDTDTEQPFMGALPATGTLVLAVSG